MTDEIPGLSTVGVQHAERVEVPDLAELFNRRMSEVMSKINCCHLGTVKSFNSAKQTVTASINYKAIVDGKLYEYPLLLDVPIFVYKGGNASSTMPIAAGDTCILLFNDRSIDNWLTTGDVSSAPNGERVHDMSDAICFVGISSFGNLIQGYVENAISHTMGTTAHNIFEAGHQILGGGKSLRSVFDDWFNGLLTHLISLAWAHLQLSGAHTNLAGVFTALAGESQISSGTRALCTAAAALHTVTSTNMLTQQAADLVIKALTGTVQTDHAKIVIA